jgi:hypothetical protein
VAFDLNSVNPVNAETPLTVSGYRIDLPVRPVQPDPELSPQRRLEMQLSLSGSIAYIYNTASKTCKALNSADSTIVSAINLDSNQNVNGVTISYDNSNASATDQPNLYGKNLQIVMNCDAERYRTKMRHGPTPRTINTLFSPQLRRQAAVTLSRTCSASSRNIGSCRR